MKEKLLQPIFTKAELIQRLIDIKELGWVENRRHGNVGGVGNTLEELLGIEENNLPIPNAAEWELKCQRLNSNSLTTLFHIEPSPTALRFVPAILLPLYGWPHKEAGGRHPASEKSFRQTIGTLGRSDRGFKVEVDWNNEKILISFDSKSVAERHAVWLEGVKSRVGLGELDPQPYWGFDDLYHKAGTKLHNCFFVRVMVRKEGEKEYFHYTQASMLQNFSKEKFIRAIESGSILIDFDARTGHNHGTKFRFRSNKLPELYDKVTQVVG